MWIPRPFLTKILTHDISYYLWLFVIVWWLYDDYLMIIWWLFVLLWLFVTLKCERERLTRFCIRQAMLPHNAGGQACTFSENSLRFACFIAAKRPPCTTAVNTSHPAQPMRESGWSWKGERGIEYVIKCSRASWLARACTLVSALVSSRALARARANNALVYLRARASMSASVLHACEGRKELSWWT